MHLQNSRMELLHDIFSKLMWTEYQAVRTKSQSAHLRIIEGERVRTEAENGKERKMDAQSEELLLCEGLEHFRGS